MTDLTAVRACVFDTYDTLFNVHATAAHCRPILGDKAEQLSVDRLAVQPHEIRFMSSNAWNAAGTAHFGFQVIWINRFGQPPENLPGRPKAALTDPTGLVDLLKETAG